MRLSNLELVRSAVPEAALGQINAAEDKRFELLRGLHPNTLSNTVDICSRRFVTVRHLHGCSRGGQPRTVMDGSE